ncbi:uncharacterized protein CMU_040090 [Cryptosporidium muris RN66]|uniref:Uncharacterized protein n=1 Tax=Cryptosporidium muris (strain RN66) TaxID=441375 RepID=B6A9P9_CRYMR|nr:uncharacterized protein CMU_040090 [Cryptosporidium muris RN66]EEA04940.1 hypothetical protein, conserved [Cryptosporidium muris RN66]|eukprot:XP_002139289.1 hypothetical protein [Cryptosporidium muris RN66]
MEDSQNNNKLKGSRSRWDEKSDKERISTSLATSAAQEALEKARRAALVQLQIQQQLAALRKNNFSNSETPLLNPKDEPYRISGLERESDGENQTVSVKPLVLSTLKVNMNIERTRKFKKEVLDSANNKSGKFIEDLTGYDPTLITKKKTKKGLRFIKAGTFTQREEAEQESVNRKKKRSLRGNNEMCYLNDIDILSRKPIPEFESWDLQFIKRKNSEYSEEFPFEILYSKITNLIEHPVPIEPYYDPDTAAVPLVTLTPAERAKLRRRRRQEKEQEKQDRIRMGLEPPPPPKIKLSNLLNVYGDRAVLDPSNIEQQIRKQMEERVKAHEQRNLARQLTPEERSKKNAEKWQMKPSDSVVFCAIFHVEKLFYKRYIFKIDRNAKDCHLTGCCVVNSSGPSIIYIEGSQKSIKFYKNLMLRRIKWDEPSDCEATSCNIVWEGTEKSQLFKSWKLYYCHSSSDAYSFFSNNNVLHLWDISQSFKIKSTDI